MRRFLTLGLALGLSAIVAVAIVDAFEGSEVTQVQAEGPASTASETVPTETGAAAPTSSVSWLGDGPALARRLARNGMRGTLYLSADGCLDGNERHLRALHLPDLTVTEGPRSGSCSFTLSADGENAAGKEAVWSPRAPVFVAEIGADALEVIAVTDLRGGRVGLHGSAPAFKPDGTLTHVEAGAVREWTTDCAQADAIIASPPIAFTPGQRGSYCRRTALARNELANALPRGARFRGVDALAWLDGSRVHVVLGGAGGWWLAVYERGRSLGAARRLTARTTLALEADPEGRFVAVSPDGHLEVYDRDAGYVWGSPIEAAAYAWSPDGEWLAYSAEGNVYLVRTSDWTTRFSLPVSTEGLAWR